MDWLTYLAMADLLLTFVLVFVFEIEWYGH